MGVADEVRIGQLADFARRHRLVRIGTKRLDEDEVFDPSGVDDELRAVLRVGESP